MRLESAVRRSVERETLDPLMVVRIHQGQLNLRKLGPDPALASDPNNQSVPLVYRNDLAVEDDFGTRQLGTDVPA